MKYKVGDKVRILESATSYGVGERLVGKIGTVIGFLHRENIIVKMEEEGVDFMLKEEHIELVKEEPIVVEIELDSPQVQFSSKNKELFLELTNTFLEQGYVIYSYMDEKDTYHLEGYYDR